MIESHKTSANKPAPGNAGIAPRLRSNTIGPACLSRSVSPATWPPAKEKLWTQRVKR